MKTNQMTQRKFLNGEVKMRENEYQYNVSK